MRQKTKNQHKNKFLGLDSTFFTADIARERKYLFENIALMVAGGLSIADVLDSLQRELKSTKIKNMVGRMYEDVLSGEPFWKALQKTKLLSDHLLSIIRIGEQSGRLSENLQIVVEQKERDADFRNKVRSASLYPGIVTALMVIVTLGIGIFILPQLAKIYENIGVELPTITKIMIAIGNFMAEYGFILGPVIMIALIGIIFLLFVYKGTKFLGQLILLRTPVIGRLLKEVEISRLGFLLGTLLEAGIPLNEGLKLLQESTSLNNYEKLYKQWVDSIESGYSFQETFQKVKLTQKLIPIYPRQAIITGEKTTSLGKSLLNIGKVYKKKNENTAKDLSVLLEPVLLILVWLGVSAIAFAVILPIYSLVGNINELSDPQQSQTKAPTSENVSNFNAIRDSEVADNSTGELKIISTSADVFDAINGSVVNVVNNGDIYNYIDTQSGWYLIEISNKQPVWIQADNVEIL